MEPGRAVQLLCPGRSCPAVEPGAGQRPPAPRALLSSRLCTPRRPNRDSPGHRSSPRTRGLGALWETGTQGALGETGATGAHRVARLWRLCRRHPQKLSLESRNGLHPEPQPGARSSPGVAFPLLSALHANLSPGAPGHPQPSPHSKRGAQGGLGARRRPRDGSRPPVRARERVAAPPAPAGAPSAGAPLRSPDARPFT